MRSLFLALSLLCFGANAQPFAQIGLSLMNSKPAAFQSISAEAGYRVGAFDFSIGVADTTLPTQSMSLRYLSKTASAIGYVPLGGPVAALVGVQGSTDHADDFAWRYGVGLVGQVNGLSISLVTVPAQSGQVGVYGFSVKKRF